MKKTLKIIFCCLGILFVVFIGFLLCVNAFTADAKLDKNRLINPERSVNFYDSYGELLCEQSNGIDITEFNEIPTHTKNAFIAIEDKRFYKHSGVDYHGLIRATVNNIKSFSLKEGASTITQQLIKNTHLSNEKTLKRKLKEIKLAQQLEKEYSKDEILEKYLNTIYFGDNCYGITSAALHYFNKSPNQLNLNESAMLAGIVKAPSHYSPFVNIDKCLNRKNLVLKQMLIQGYITENEYIENTEKALSFNIEKTNTSYDYIYFANQELNNLIDTSPYSIDNLNVHTTFDSNYQRIIEKCASEFSNNNCEISVILTNKNSSVLSYYSTIGNVKRQMGSVIKPLAIYAPAIERDLVNSYTVLSDTKTDFNGYSPSNYNDKYRGNISVKDSLAFSSNVCAVKLLNYVGIENSVKILQEMNFNITDGDKALTLALGATENGATLSNITSAYNIFSNKGLYTATNCIKDIKIKSNQTIYKNNSSTKQIIQDDTAFILCDMLQNNVKNGTAKKLSFVSEHLYAKTGTVGNKNGNTDAYIISFNNELTLGVWCGNKNGSLLDNSISGGTLPTIIAQNIWQQIYSLNNDFKEIERPKNIIDTYIDKDSYEQDQKIILADDLAPNRYKIKAIFKKSALPKNKATYFSSPEITNYKTIVKHNEIQIELCQTEYINSKIYKMENNKKTLVFDSQNNNNIFTDKNVEANKIYEYVIVPYFQSENNIYYGKEIVLEKIKTPNNSFGDDWWSNIE